MKTTKSINYIVFLLSLLIINNSLTAQQKDVFYNVLSPSYSFSYSKVKASDTSEFKSISNGFSLNLFRYGYRIKNFEGAGGISLHYVSTAITEINSNLDITYFGMAPELRVKYYPLTLDNGLFIGTGGQFFVLPLIVSPNIKAMSFRPMFMAGMSKDFGFTMFCVPNMITGKVGNQNINKSWYLGMEVDIPWSKLF